MKRASTIAVLLIVVIGLARYGLSDAGVDDPILRWLAIASALLLAAVVVVAIASGLDHRSEAALRLDWFLPELRRVRDGQQANRRWFGGLLHRLIPETWQSNHRTKQRGQVRRTLRKLGNSWLASPVRRGIQAVCLALFLGSFFYVCWPYSSRPLEPALASTEWRFIGFDQEKGSLQFTNPNPEPWILAERIVVLGNESLTLNASMRVSEVASANLVNLIPEEELPDELFDAVLTSDGEWTLYERDPNAWPTHYADELASRERLPADLFLAIDPLVSLSTAIASRSWVWSLTSAAIILIVCLIVPRGFCGYICPLGTTIDLFDWAIGSRTKRFQVEGEGWWVHIKYYLLAGTLVAASMGVLLSGFVAAIPVITRAMLFLGEPIQSGAMRGWHLVPSFNLGHVVSLVLFVGLLCLGFLRPRFWCKYVCPSGAVFSLGNLFRVTERKVESSCIHCNKCVEICPFDAIKPDFTTRGTDCTMCQSCGGVCPTHAIKFVERWNVVELKVEDDPPTGETVLGRRGFMSLAGGGAAAVVGGAAAAVSVKAFGANLNEDAVNLPIRPPGSVPEEEFLQMCIRCGECFKVCPNNVLQPEGFQQGLEGLWTPRVEADWAGCESSCNACGQVCPTGAIRSLAMEEKRVARMGLAVVNEATCLPMAGKEDCDLCVQECIAAGYDAIEYIQVGTEVDEFGIPLAGSGMLAPVVLQDKCVGCGLCQTRCYGINVKQRGILSDSAIIVEAGEGKEDRLMHGSYRDLRQQESEQRNSAREQGSGQQTVQQTGEVSEEIITAEESSTKAIEEATPMESDNPFGL